MTRPGPVGSEVSGAAGAGAGVLLRPAQVRDAEVVGVAPAGAYTRLSVHAPQIAAQVSPGHFVAFAVGGRGSAMLLRRSFSVAAARPDGVVEVVVAVAGAGTAWLAARRPGDRVDVVGPLGRPFPLPGTALPAVLVGGGYGSAPLFALASALRERGCEVTLVLGAATAQRLLLDAAYGDAVLTTDDGSAGLHGRVTDALGPLLGRRPVVYACGPMPMLAAVTALADAAGCEAWVAVEEAMACGIGVCMTCVLPVRGADGVARMARSCTEGPVFPGTDVLFDAVGTVPA